jgi:membrane protease YdiL (CAAX protease family)
MIKQIINSYFMWLMPLLEGASHAFFPYHFLYYYFQSELGAWLVKGVIFLGISLFIFGKSFYQRHAFTIKGYRFNSIALYVFLYFIVGSLFHISGNSFLISISTAMIFIPILEEFAARGCLINIPTTHKKTLITIIILSSATFSLSHWFTNESLTGIISWQQHVCKFLAHFNFGLMQAIITINYKKIDLAIILHMIGNISWVIMSL